jgi:type II secretory pathway component PulM
VAVILGSAASNQPTSERAASAQDQLQEQRHTTASVPQQQKAPKAKPPGKPLDILAPSIR